MQINADFSLIAKVHGARESWIPSPMPGVERIMLDRIGDEVARATSLVRYAPNSHFSPHTHEGGEEFYVLEGVFEDESGQYPAGTYVRNPPTSSHEPGAEAGCVIFVKLRQFDPEDRRQFSVDVSDWAQQEGRERQCYPLLKDEAENVRVEYWPTDAEVDFPSCDGIEFLVLEGGFECQGEDFEKWSWLRIPSDQPVSMKASSSGCRVWIKSGHLVSPVIY